jgi:hypothetical protein
MKACLFSKTIYRPRLNPPHLDDILATAARKPAGRTK